MYTLTEARQALNRQFTPENPRSRGLFWLVWAIATTLLFLLSIIEFSIGRYFIGSILLLYGVGYTALLSAYTSSINLRDIYEVKLELFVQYARAEFTSCGLPLGTRLYFEGNCGSCGQLLTPAEFGTQCLSGHLAHYVCLTKDDDRLRCPQCLLRKTEK